MNFKKFISGVSALTIAASAFAGMAVTANAVTVTRTIYSNDFETAAWTNSGNFTTTNISGDDTNHYFYINHPSGSNGSRTNTATFTSSSTADGVTAIKVEFDWNMSSASNTGNITAVGGENANVSYDNTTGVVFTMTDIAFAIGAGDVGDDTYTAAGKWNRDKLCYYDPAQGKFIKTTLASDTDYHVTADIDFAEHTVSYSIGGNNYGPFTTSVTEISKMINGNYRTRKGSNYMIAKIDNFKMTYTEDVEEAPYYITTTPYAAVKVDNAAAVSAGADGKYTFEYGDTATHNVTISKTGYDSQENISITPENNGSREIMLTPSSGITYYENFAYVNDAFGTNTNNTVISADGLQFTVASGQLSSTATFPDAVDVSNKLITLDIGAYAVNGNNNVKITLNGLNTTIGFQTSGQRWRIDDDHATDYFGNSATEYHKLQFYKNASNNRISMYLDGKAAGAAVGGKTGNSFTGINIDAVNYNSGYKTKVNIKSVEVAAMPGEVSVKLGDDAAVTYLAGTTVTIPAAAEGYEWHDASDNVVEAGDVVVNENLTLTAVAVTPAGPTAEVTGISYKQFAAEDTDAKSDEDVTAAKVFVKTTGTVTRVGLSYNKSAAQYAGDLTMTDATIVFGAIVPGRVDLQISNFTAVVE